MDVEAEIRDLKRRVSELEGSFGFLTRQVGDVHKDLLAFEARTEVRFEQVDSKLREHDGRFDRLESKVDGVDRNVDGLARSLPRVVADTMREVLREQKGKS